MWVNDMTIRRYVVIRYLQFFRLCVTAYVNNRSYQTVHVCKTEFWVIQQNRKHFGFHFRLRDPTDRDFRQGKSPEEYYIRDWYRDQSPSIVIPVVDTRLPVQTDYTNRIQLPN